jgi:hypothetical protein
MDQLTRAQRYLVGGIVALVGLVICIIGGTLADSTGTAWPGVLVIAGLILAFVGVWLTNTPKSQRRQQQARSVVPTAAGWYPDPESPSIRFWDGKGWTDQRAPLPAQVSTGPSAWTIARGVAVGIIIVIVLVAWFGGGDSSCTGYGC